MSMSILKNSGSSPFSYQLINHVLIPKEDESSIRKKIFEIFIDCKRLKTTAEKINQKGYRTRSNLKFTDKTILRLLTDSIS